MNQGEQVSCRPESGGTTCPQISVLELVLLGVTLASVCGLLISDPGASQAQGTTSITHTPGAGDLGTTVTQVGHLYNITGGTRPGNGPILFHSFGDFTVGAGDIGNFLNNTPTLTTSNILGRVTGGNISNIYGAIHTTDFGNANLFLINPSGTLFGPNASLDVGGSVSVTTAQYMRLFDGVDSANFYANPANDGLANSVFAMDPVADFGFLPAAYGFLDAPNPIATITVQGSALSVLPGQSISLVGGNVSIQGVILPDATVQPARLSAPKGTIQLANTASPGEFDLATLQPLPNVDGTTSFTSFGSVSLAPGSSIDVSGTRTVFVKGGQLVLSVNDATLNTSEVPAPQDTVLFSQGSSIVTSNSGTEPGADVQITVGSLSLDGAGTAIGTQTLGDRNGGNITANVGTLSVTNGAVIKTETSVGLGRGGDVSITAGTVLIDTTSEVFTQTFLGNGMGGNLVLNVGTLTLNGGSAIRTTALTLGTDLDGDGVPDAGSTGSGGNVTIQGITGSVADSVVLSGGSRIASESGGFGDGGRLSIAATSVNLDGASSIESVTTGLGHGGDIVLSVQQASLSGEATIASRARSEAGEGGRVTVQGLQGEGSKADALTLAGVFSRILSESEGSGRPGDIEMHAKTVSLTDRASIEAGTKDSNGTGGKVIIDATSVGIVGGSLISSQARAQDAGQVTITANELTLDNGSVVTTTASEVGGRGGDVVVNVGRVSLANGATINSSTSQTGRAGDIAMNVDILTLTTGSQISSASSGTVPFTDIDGTTEVPGRAGNVTITAAGSFTSDASTVATSAEANHGGDVSVTAHSVQLSNGTLITANSNAPLEVKETVLINGQLVEQVVGDGNAGNITVHSGSTFVMTNSSMTTEASRASGGQIKIITPEMVRVINGRVSTSVAGSATDTAGGNITIDPQFVVLQGGQIVAKAFAGSGGAIDIIAGSAFISDPASIVDASSTTGISGTVNIQSPLQNVGGELAALSQEFSSAAALLAQQCAARAADGKFSTFVVAAREGVPVEPGGFLASPLLTSESLGSRLSGRDSYPEFSTVTGAFSEYEARPIQLAKLGNACR